MSVQDDRVSRMIDAADAADFDRSLLRIRAIAAANTASKLRLTSSPEARFAAACSENDSMRDALIRIRNICDGEAK